MKSNKRTIRLLAVCFAVCSLLVITALFLSLLRPERKDGGPRLGSKEQRPEIIPPLSSKTPEPSSQEAADTPQSSETAPSGIVLPTTKKPIWNNVTFPNGNSAAAVNGHPIACFKNGDQPPIRYVQNELILRLPRGATPDDLSLILTKYGLTLSDQDDAFAKLRSSRVLITDGVDVLEVKNQVVTNEPTLKTPEPNYVVSLLTTVQDPLLDHQTYVPACKFDSAWKLLTTQREVVVAIIDTGVDRKHPELAGKLLEGRNILDHTRPPEDDNGHGTFLAGIIAANWNGEGIRGLAPNARILPIKAIDATGVGTTADVANGILFAVDSGASVICLSIGSYANSQLLQDAVDYALESGSILVAAAGNDGIDLPIYPASFPDVISVGSIDSNRNLSIFSNTGRYIDILAPGVAILSTVPNGYGIASGTSASAGIVSALAAILISERPGSSIYGLQRSLCLAGTELSEQDFLEIAGVRIPILNAIGSIENPSRPFHEVSIRKLSLDHNTVKNDNLFNVITTIENVGSFATETSRVTLILINDSGSQIEGEINAEIRNQMTVVFPLDIEKYHEDTLIDVWIEPDNDTDLLNNRKHIGPYRARKHDDLNILYANEPPVHQWIAYRGWQQLATGSIRNEVEKYLGASNDDALLLSPTWDPDDTEACWNDDGHDAPCNSSSAIIEGTWEEDEGDLGSRPGNHFWKPSCGYDCGMPLFSSAVRRAETFYQKALTLYPTNQGDAYYWVGRCIHLLCDVSVPAHSLLDPHVHFLGDPDNYELYTAYSSDSRGPIYKTYTDGPSISVSLLPDYPGMESSPYKQMIKLFYNVASASSKNDSNDRPGTVEQGSKNSFNNTVVLSFKLDAVSSVKWYKQTTDGNKSGITPTELLLNTDYEYDMKFQMIVLSNWIANAFDRNNGLPESKYDILEVRYYDQEDKTRVENFDFFCWTGLIGEGGPCAPLPLVPSSVFDRRSDFQNAIGSVAELYRVFWQETHCNLTTVVKGDGNVDPPGSTEQVCSVSVNVSHKQIDPCWVFDHWEDEAGKNPGNANPLPVLMNGDRTITAVFVKLRFDLTTKVNPEGSRTVDLTPPGPTYDCETTVKACAVPAKCWKFDRWTGDLSGTSVCNNVLMSGDRSITANFVQEEVIADFIADKTECCSPCQICFTDRSTGPGISSRLWDFGDGSQSNIQDPCHIYQQPGTYRVCLTVQGDCGSNTRCKDAFIAVKAPLIADFLFNPPSPCVLFPVQFTNRSSGDVQSCKWEFGDGTGSTDCNPQHTYASVGDYQVCLTVNNSCSQATICKALQVTGPPIVEIVADALEGCPPLNVCFKAQGAGGDPVLWSFCDGTQSRQAEVCHLFAKPGLCQVSLEVTGRCGKVTRAVSVRVLEPPVAAIAPRPDDPPCAPLSVQFKDASKGDGLSRWLWDFGDGSTSTDQHPTHVYSDPGRYCVTLRVTGTCGEASSEAVCIDVEGPPAPVTSLTCTPQVEDVKEIFVGDQVELCWPPAEGTTGYRVCASVDGGECIPLFEAANLCEKFTLNKAGSWIFMVIPFNQCGDGEGQGCGPIDVRPSLIIGDWFVGCRGGSPIIEDKDPDRARTQRFTMNGSPQCAPDRCSNEGASIRFTGNDWFLVEGVSGLEAEENFSLSFWFSPAESPSPSQVVLEVLGGQVLWDGSSGLLSFVHGQLRLESQGLLKDWHHVDVTRTDGMDGTVSLYVDGISMDSGESHLPLSDSVSFGADTLGQNPFEGTLDDVLYERRARSEQTVIQRIVNDEPGLCPTVYLRLEAEIVTRPVIAEAGRYFKALTVQILTGRLTEGDCYRLSKLRILARDLTTPGAGQDSAVLEALTLGSIFDCDALKDAEPLGMFKAAESSDLGRVEYEVILDPWYVLREEAENRFEVRFQFGSAVPVDQIIQFGVQQPGDIEIVREPGDPVYVAGRRLSEGLSLEGDKLETKLPELRILPLPPPQTIEETSPVKRAEVHRLSLEGGQSGGVTVNEIIYRPLEDTTLSGMTNVRLFADLNNDGKSEKDEGRGTVIVDRQSGEIRISDVNQKIGPGVRIEFLLTADLEVRTEVVSASPLDSGKLALLGLPFCGLLLLLGRRWNRRLCVTMLMVIMCVCLGLGYGCNKGGGGGHGIAEKPLKESRFQVGILTEEDLKVSGAIQGFPQSGILGPVFVVRGR